MKMKRVDDQNNPVEIKDEAPKVPNIPKKSLDGIVVMTPPEEDEPRSKPKDPSDTMGKLQRGPGNTFNVLPPEDQMEEVSYKDLAKEKQAAIVEGDADTRKAISEIVRGLIDKSADAAKVVLEDLLGKKQISDYRMVPMGAPVSMEFEAGRVQVVLDAGKRVIDVQLG